MKNLESFSVKTESPESIRLRNIYAKYDNVDFEKAKEIYKTVKENLTNFKIKEDGKSLIVIQRFVPIYKNSNLYIFVNITRKVEKLFEEKNIYVKKNRLLSLFCLENVKEFDAFICNVSSFTSALNDVLILKGEPLFEETLVEPFEKMASISKRLRPLSNNEIAELINSQNLETLEKVYPETFQVFYGLLFYIIKNFSSEEEFSLCKTLFFEGLDNEKKRNLYKKALNLLKFSKGFSTLSETEKKTSESETEYEDLDLFVWKNLSYKRSLVLKDLKARKILYVEKNQTVLVLQGEIRNPSNLEKFKTKDLQTRSKILLSRLKARSSDFKKSIKKIMRKPNQNQVPEIILENLGSVDFSEFLLLAENIPVKTETLEDSVLNLFESNFALDEEILQKFNKVLDNNLSLEDFEKVLYTP